MDVLEFPGISEEEVLVVVIGLWVCEGNCGGVEDKSEYWEGGGKDSWKSSEDVFMTRDSWKLRESIAGATEVSLGAEKSLEVWEIGFGALEMIVLRSVGEIVSWRSGVSNPW